MLGAFGCSRQWYESLVFDDTLILHRSTQSIASLALLDCYKLLARRQRQDYQVSKLPPLSNWFSLIRRTYLFCWNEYSFAPFNPPTCHRLGDPLRHPLRPPKWLCFMPGSTGRSCL